MPLKEQVPKEELERQARVEKRERLFRKLQVTHDLIKDLPKDESVFLARADKADADYQLFEEIQDKLTRLNLLMTDEVEIANVSRSYEELYFIVISKSHEISEAKESVRKNEASLHNQSVQEVKTLRPKLPPIDIPKFKGDIEKFSPFISLYDTLVHNTELSTIQKFSFLKSYLEYPALSVVESFDFNDENYQLAYNKLVERYTDKRLVGTHYLNKLLQFKYLQNSSPNNLRQFLDVFVVQYQSLKALKIPDLTDFVVFNLAMKVLDNDTKRLFEDRHSKQAFPSFNDLVLFVTEQHKVAALLQPPVKYQLQSTANVKVNKPNACNKSGMTTKTFMLNSQCATKNVNNDACSEYVKPPFTCPLCESDHKLYSCPKFTAMSPAKRFESAKSLKVCYACLGPHSRSKCTSKYACFKCKSKNHHTMLHNDQYRDPDVKSDKSSEGQSKGEQAADQITNTLSCHVESQVAKSNVTSGLLGTAKARIQSYNGDWVNCRMIIDPASESSFITESLAQSLMLPRRKLTIDVVGVGSSTFKNHRGCVSCTITTPRTPVGPKLSVEAIVLHSISSEMPKMPLHPDVRNRFSHLQLADPDYDKPASIDFLLGVQHYSELLTDNPIHIRGEPAALNTIFGFVIFGKVPAANKESPCTSTSFLIHTPSTDEMLQRFWESEEPNNINPKNSTQDEECEVLFSQTTVRDDCGRYQVSLPFNKEFSQEKLGSTRQVAYKRLLSVENKLSSNPELKELYNANLQDYVDQDHMRPATSRADYVMTHHAVIKESSTTQVRVVFNASEKSDTSRSLNEFLLPGPKLQTDISQVLLSFRMNPVALTADLKQMFRCIRLNPSDTKYTHILWRQNHTLPITEWEITTLPFGLTCSPYLAQRTIKQLVSDEGNHFPQASKVLRSNSYIDDIVTSVCSEEAAINLYNELTELLRKGGFFLHKLSTNSENVLLHIPKQHHERPLTFEPSNCIKLLGFLWDPLSDMFGFKFSMEDPTCSKRGVLSQVARIYDINGHLTPITFWIKYFIQRLWLSGIGWDEDLPPQLKQHWLEFYSQLSDISKIRIPRYISYNNVSSIMLIGFCDASERGYAACIYIRIQSVHGEIKVYLLKAKSKVAPIKPVTIPRLELNGAVLLSKLIHSMSDFLSQLPSHEVYCCTDSTTVLSWLHTPPHQLKTYVANRVVEVLNVTSPASWRHVPGKLNAADIASRGSFPTHLINNDLWWYGPDYLKEPRYDWPHEELNIVHPIPELKSESVALISRNDKICDINIVETILKSTSSLTKAQRVLSYVLRFIHNVRSPEDKQKTGCVSFSEMDNALRLCIKVTQEKYLHDEINCVKKEVPVKGFIRHLTPFLTEDGMFRVGGRLTLAPMSESSKHPYLIPRQSRLAELICLHYHYITLHGGTQLMQSLIQRKFWIPGNRYLLRSIVFKCVNCYRFKAKPLTPLMSSIPSSRFKQGRAFVNTGVDLAGPYLLKESKRRNARSNKCWIVLFICLSTRAVYIDLVSDISTASFLSSFDRFIARRGLPSRMHSDLGTNFVGAARELRDIHTLLTQESDQIKRYCEDRQIVWEFNPPSAPNFGGSWEAAIKSMKHHLRRVIADKPLTHEEFATLLARIEAILNSRPLCPISSSTDDGFDYLTPGHFLVGAPLLLSRPEEDVLSQTMNFNSRWQLITHSIQDIWRRWSQEYIHTLIHRPKWDKKIPNIKIGQLVLLIDKNLPPTSWSLGRIIEIFKGSDGIVRVARIKTPSGTLTRPVNKLCILPIEDNC